MPLAPSQAHKPGMASGQGREHMLGNRDVRGRQSEAAKAYRQGYDTKSLVSDSLRRVLFGILA